MKRFERILFILFLAFFLWPTFGFGLEGIVIVKSGVILRETPSADSARVGKIPFNGKVQVVKRTSYEEEIEGIRGAWLQVKFRELDGYVFGGFVREIEPDDESNGIFGQFKLYDLSNGIQLSVPGVLTIVEGPAQELLKTSLDASIDSTELRSQMSNQNLRLLGILPSAELYGSVNVFEDPKPKVTPNALISVSQSDLDEYSRAIKGQYEQVIAKTGNKITKWLGTSLIDVGGADGGKA